MLGHHRWVGGWHSGRMTERNSGYPGYKFRKLDLFLWFYHPVLWIFVEELTHSSGPRAVSCFMVTLYLGVEAKASGTSSQGCCVQLCRLCTTQLQGHPSHQRCYRCSNLFRYCPNRLKAKCWGTGVFVSSLYKSSRQVVTLDQDKFILKKSEN